MLLPDIFNLLLAEIFPAAEAAEMNSPQPNEGEQTTQPAGRTPRSLSPSTPTRKTEELSSQWFPLCPLPTPRICLSHPALGRDTLPSPVSAALGTTGLVEATSPSPGVPRPTNGVELLTKPTEPRVVDERIVPPSGSRLTPEMSARPVILEGWMRDRPFQTESPILEAPEVASHPIADLDIKDRSAYRVLGEPAPTPRPQAQQSAESAAPPSGQPSGQQEPDSDRRQKPDLVRRQEPATSSASDSPWTSPPPVPPAARPGGPGQTAAPATRLDQPAAAHPAEQPDSEAAPHQPHAITIRLQATAGRPVDLRFTETRGDVKVTIRTEDTRLASAVANDLPALERGLESRGWSAEFRVPNRSLESRPSEEIRLSNHEPAQSSVRSVGPELDTSGQGSEPEHRTNWVEEIEDRNVAAALRRLSIQGGQL